MRIENRPYYRKLYEDMIRDKYPEKIHLCKAFFQKEVWIALDVIRVNKILFTSSRGKPGVRLAKKHHAYDIESIIEILDYQYKHALSNTEVGRLYGISRNTVSKWKIAFSDEIKEMELKYQ